MMDPNAAARKNFGTRAAGRCPVGSSSRYLLWNDLLSSPQSLDEGVVFYPPALALAPHAVMVSRGSGGSRSEREEARSVSGSRCQTRSAPGEDQGCLPVTPHRFQLGVVVRHTRFRDRSAIGTNGCRRPDNQPMVSNLRPSPSTHPNGHRRSVSMRCSYSSLPEATPDGARHVDGDGGSAIRVVTTNGRVWLGVDGDGRKLLTMSGLRGRWSPFVQIADLARIRLCQPDSRPPSAPPARPWPQGSGADRGVGEQCRHTSAR